MLTLVVERSTCRPGWALFRDDVCQLEAVSDQEPSREPDWVARLGAALEAAHIPLPQIDRFAAGLGPGSFSGTRAAVAALQGMALPGQKPLVGVSSAAALAFALLTARAAQHIHTPVAVIGDARRERLWCAVFTLPTPGVAAAVSAAETTSPDTGAATQKTQLLSLTPTGLRPPTHDAADFTLTPWTDLASHLPPDTLVVTPDWPRIGTRLSSLLPAHQILPGAHLPTAADVGRLLLSDPSAAHLEPMPIYLHPAVAEVRA